MANDKNILSITKESLDALDEVLTKLPDQLNKERALMAAQREAGKVFMSIADRLTGSPGFFKTVDNQSAPGRGRSYINSLNSTITQKVVRGPKPKGLRVGFAAEKGRYVSFHGNFLESGTVLRKRKSGASTGKLRAYNLQKMIWDTGITRAKNILQTSLPKIVDRLYKKIYKEPKIPKQI